MVRVLAVVVAAAATLGAGIATTLGAGVAAAEPSTYEVSGTWTLTQVNGQPRIQPEIKDDTIDVVCRNGDRMKDYAVSDSALVSGSWKHTDDTGVSVEPKLTRPGQRLTVTVTCKSG